MNWVTAMRLFVLGSIAGLVIGLLFDTVWALVVWVLFVVLAFVLVAVFAAAYEMGRDSSSS
jgi:hypothetical protein